MRRTGCSKSERLQAGVVSHTAFTLVELLVVIAIIAMLIGLLTAALGAAFDASQLATCASNQRQVGIALINYSGDYDGVIPYGPKPSPKGVVDFYIVEGLVTSQLSLYRTGEPVGIGLLLDDYLSETPEVLFCPGTDDGMDAAEELAKVGQTQAVSGYFYRHGSNTLSDATTPRPGRLLDDNILLRDLGLNRNGQPIRALLMDQNFKPGTGIPAFGVVKRTNHGSNVTQVLYYTGDVQRHRNDDEQFTAEVTGSVHLGPEMILRAFEEADAR